MLAASLPCGGDRMLRSSRRQTSACRLLAPGDAAEDCGSARKAVTGRRHTISETLAPVCARCSRIGFDTSPIGRTCRSGRSTRSAFVLIAADAAGRSSLAALLTMIDLTADFAQTWRGGTPNPCRKGTPCQPLCAWAAALQPACYRTQHNSTSRNVTKRAGSGSPPGRIGRYLAVLDVTGADRHGVEQRSAADGRMTETES